MLLRVLRLRRSLLYPRVLARLGSSVAGLKWLLLFAPEVTDFRGKAELTPGVRQNPVLGGVIPRLACWVSQVSKSTLMYSFSAGVI